VSIFNIVISINTRKFTQWLKVIASFCRHNPIVRCDQIPRLDLNQFPPINTHKRSDIGLNVSEEQKRAEVDASIKELLETLEELDSLRK